MPTMAGCTCSSGYGTTSPQDGRHLFGPAGGDVRRAGVARARRRRRRRGKRRGGASTRRPRARRRVATGRASCFRDAGIAAMRVGGAALPARHQRRRRHQRLRQPQAQRSAVVRVSPRRRPARRRSRAATSTRRMQTRETGFAARRITTPCAVDGVEQNELKPEWLFRLFETSQGRARRRSRTAPTSFEYVGRHHGYERLPQPGDCTSGRFVCRSRPARWRSSTG